jgi:hypothetical protein
MAGKLISESVGLAVCGRAAVSPTQPVAGPVVEKARLYCPPEITRTDEMARIGETTQHLALDIVGHEITAVGAGACRERLFLQPLQPRGLTSADIGVERRLVLGLGRIAQGIGAASQGRAGAIEGEAVETALGVVESGVDAGELLVRHHVAREPGLDLGQARVVGVLERLEGTGEIIEGRGDIVGHGFGFNNGNHHNP